MMRFHQCLWAVVVGCLSAAVWAGATASDETDASLLEPTAGLSEFIDIEEPNLYKDPTLVREWYADADDEDEDEEKGDDEEVV